MRFVYIAVLAVIASSVVSAQQARVIGMITESDRTVKAVLARAGCGERWHSQALRDSGIAPSEAERLPIGREIRLSSSCRASVQNLSARRTMTRVAPRPRVSGQRSIAVRTVENPVNRALAIENEGLKAKTISLEKELQALRSTPAPKPAIIHMPNARQRGAIMAGGVLLGLVLALIGATGWSIHRRLVRKKDHSRVEVVVDSELDRSNGT